MNAGTDYEGVIILSVGLNIHTMLRELNLSWIPNITEPAWHAIFDALQIPTFRLKKLDIGGNNINVNLSKVSTVLTGA